MLINEFRMHNFKSFRATPPIALSAGFNVFVGKNNAGKTALLEALSLSTLTNKPHRHSGFPRGHPLSPQSRVHVAVTLTPADLRQAFLNASSFWFPVPPQLNQDRYASFLQEFLGEAREFRFPVYQGLNIGPSPFPSHGMFSEAEAGRSVEFAPNQEGNGFRINQTAANSNDTTQVAAGRFAIQSIYSFKAERLSLASFPHGDNPALAPNAENLPVALNILQGQHDRFARFNSLVSQVFPTIRRVSVRPVGGNDVIMVWNSDAPSDRVDLAVELSESGTGVGQVLAMFTSL